MLTRRELRDVIVTALVLLCVFAAAAFVVAVTSRPPAPLSVWEPGR